MEPIIKKKRIILFNGPTGSDKFKTAEILKNFYGFEVISIWGEFRKRVHGLYGLEIDQDHFFKKELYDKKTHMFNGLTPKEAYKRVFNQYVFPNHGHGFFLDPIIQKIDESENSKIVIPDLRTNLESSYFFNYYGTQTILLKFYKNGLDFDKTIANKHYVEDKFVMVNLKDGRRRANRGIINNNGNCIDIIRSIAYYYKAFFKEDMKTNEEDKNNSV